MYGKNREYFKWGILLNYWGFIVKGYNNNNGCLLG